MSRKKQNVRLSNFILQLGPGAIVETPGGPRIVLSTDTGLFQGGINPHELEVEVPYVGTGSDAETPAAAFLLPPEAAWKTQSFPVWKLCTEHWILHARGCPECTQEQRAGSREQAIRFVMACPAGHLDEVHWSRLVHGRSWPHDEVQEYYRWEHRGSRLAQTYVVCPVCGKEAPLSRAYYGEHECTGRFPENEEPGAGAVRPRNCDQKMRMIQRQAVNLRIPEVQTFLTVPPMEAGEYRMLQLEKDELIHTLRVAGLLRGAQEKLQVTRENGLPAPAPEEGERLQEVFEMFLERAESTRRGWDLEDLRKLAEDPGALAGAIERVLGYHRPSSPQDAWQNEFRKLLRGMDEGIPPLQRKRGARSGATTLIEMDPSGVRREIPGPGGVGFVVAPLQRLHTVTVQIGYRRAVGSTGDPSGVVGELVDMGAMWPPGADGEKKWYPAYESLGEGLFITTDKALIFQNQRWAKWMELFKEALKQSGNVLDQDVHRFHPVFVWWHTFSHLLLRVLAVDSGYSLASISERIYLDFDALSENPEQVRGAILLYTTSSGTDGTLGGLIALADKIKELIEKAVAGAEVCSSDPLCWENEFHSESPIGAACYACLLVSETSCRHRNLWLDRRLLLEK
ncbi:Protein of unknown function DUF1998 [Oceanithermus profundus DSM 14977]|uniref:MrfA-like Zn-binding domain-containing protein n=1 Tax=Oceanithermus profundus (strain DSM 14977 / NBRC 100410 / VKM B-2274 / 506) TaxID=670487 RepID=E4U6D6_OCEP5|nr:DUF1998 domain-containing protein [Oceanithermus profundus]ADR35556.1 Protein of unknown function DUF1998 [Oceanithermus profundus DSM 14977]